MLRRLTIAAALALALAASGCKDMTKSKLMPAVNIDDRLGGYLDEFLADAKAHGAHVSAGKVNGLRVFKFVDDIAAEKKHYGQALSSDENDTVGTCADLEETNTLDTGVYKFNIKDHVWKEIWLSQDYARRDADDPVLKELAYHELGHCLLGLSHAPSVPHHIMSPEVLPDKAWLLSHWDGLLGELFNPSR